MLRNLHTRINRHSLKLVAMAVLLCIAGLAAASMGGEKKNKKTTTAKKEFVPIRTTTGFTLKAGPAYKGSFTFSQNSNGKVNYQTLVTYSKGNTTYIMPYQHRVNLAPAKTGCSSTELLKLKVRIKQ